MPAEPPSRNDGVTIRPCPVCGTGYLPAGRRQHCSDACRQAAWRRRHLPAAPRRPSRPRGQNELSASMSATAAAHGLWASSTA